MLKIDLSGRTALVLGGSRGIGAGIVDTLASCGATTVFTHSGNPIHEKRVKAFLDKLQIREAEVWGIAANATDSIQTERAVQSVLTRTGRIDILVCNVGRNEAREISKISDEEWRVFLDLNLSSAFYGVRSVLKIMEKQRYGRIILIGSSAVYDGGGGALDYAAAKAALSGMLKYLCRLYTRKGILTNIIHPCVIETDLLKERYNDNNLRQKLIDQIPVGRLGQPSDIAGLTAFLVSHCGDYICGQEILVDGGRTMYNK